MECSAKKGFISMRLDRIWERSGKAEENFRSGRPLNPPRQREKPVGSGVDFCNVQLD